jgi:hypothetical protein
LGESCDVYRKASRATMFTADYTVPDRDFATSPAAFSRKLDDQDGVAIPLEYQGKLVSVVLPPGTWGYC